MFTSASETDAVSSPLQNSLSHAAEIHVRVTHSLPCVYSEFTRWECDVLGNIYLFYVQKYSEVLTQTRCCSKLSSILFNTRVPQLSVCVSVRVSDTLSSVSVARSVTDH